MKQFRALLLLLVLLTFASACQTGYTVIDRGKMRPVYVNESQAQQLQRISMQSDNSSRLQTLNQAYPSGSRDPIVLNFFGSVLLLEGDYKSAAAYFDLALRTLLHGGHVYYSDRVTLASRLNTPQQQRSHLRVRVSENRDILSGLATYFQTNRRDALFQALKNRSGHLPDPPIYKDGGLIGLSLESIAESLQHSDFHPIIIRYKRASAQYLDEERLSINAVCQNLMTACILAHDAVCLESALSMVQNYPKSYWTLALENHVAISLFLLQDREYTAFINTSNRGLFPIQNRAASPFR